jgi:mRNA interferase MazF
LRRGEVWWAELPEPIKARPVVVLTRNAVVETIGSVVVALVTRTRRGLTTEVALGRMEGLPTPCVVNLDNLLTVPRTRLVRQMGALSAKRIEELNDAIRVALELNV